MNVTFHLDIMNFISLTHPSLFARNWQLCMLSSVSDWRKIELSKTIRKMNISKLNSVSSTIGSRIRRSGWEIGNGRGPAVVGVLDVNPLTRSTLDSIGN